MAELKTKQNTRSVKLFLGRVKDDQKRRDCRDLVRLMQKITGKRPAMWGPSIVGFGSYHYQYKTGHEGDCFLTGFSPRKASLVIYVMSGFKRLRLLMRKLGKHKTGKSCLYIKKLDDIDMRVLQRLVKESVKEVGKTYG